MKIARPESQQPIPPGAKLVFRGVYFEVYHWEQKQFDGTVKTFEKMKRDDTVSVIPITPEGNILVTHQEQPGTLPFTGFPGGIIDPGEDPLAAARRELLEETGYEAVTYSLWQAKQPVSKIDWAIYTFIAKGCRKVVKPHLDSGERIVITERTFTELPAVVSREDFRDTETAIAILRTRTDPRAAAALKEAFSP